AVPGPGPGLAPAHPFALALEHPRALALGELAPRLVERDAALLGIFLEVVLALVEARALPGLDRAGAQRLRSVRDNQPVVDPDDATEAAAGLAGAERRVEREEAWAGVLIVNIAIGAMQIARETPGGAGFIRPPRGRCRAGFIRPTARRIGVCG